MDAGTPVPAAPGGRTHRAAPASRAWRLWAWCAAALREVGYLVMPSECALCGAEDQGLCLPCAAQLRRAVAAPFRAEGAADALMGVAGEVQLPVMAAGSYRDALAAAILAFKNHGRTDLGAPLARCLARGLQQMLVDLPTAPAGARNGGSKAVVLIPIPSSGAGWRRRGFDPVATLLGIMVREGRLPPGVVIVPLLGSRATLPWQRRRQKALGRSARRSNVQGSLKLRPRTARKFLLTAKPSGYCAVLIDDVLTTGSTLREAGKTLGNRGFAPMGAVVLAATQAPQPGGTGGKTHRTRQNQYGVKDE